jgi:tricorn protease
LETKDEAKKTDSATVKIDTEGLADRIVKLSVPSGSYSNFYSDGKKVFYSRGGSTYAYDLDGQKEDVVVDGATMSVEPGRKKALFRRGRNQLYVTAIPSGKVDLKDAADLSNMKIQTDYPKEWEQIFNEAWRHFRDGFYVDNMHGVDWPAMRAKYAVLLPYVKNRLDLNYVIGEMISELNCGHAYISACEMDRPKRINMGLLGAEVSRGNSGFFRLEKILPGVSWSTSLRSPLTDPGIKAEAGEFIVAIDGVPTNSVNDLYSLLVGKANVPTELMLNSRPQLNDARKVVILPLANEYPLYHNQWIQENIA